MFFLSITLLGVILSPFIALADTITNPLGASTVTVEVLAGNLIKLMFGVSGTIALVVFVYGGFMMLISAGDPKKVTQGTEAMKYAVIGLIVMLTSYIVVNFVITTLQSAGTAAPGTTPTAAPAPVTPAATVAPTTTPSIPVNAQP